MRKPTTRAGRSSSPRRRKAQRKLGPRPDGPARAMPQWLLIKHRDAAAMPLSKGNPRQEAPKRSDRPHPREITEEPRHQQMGHRKPTENARRPAKEPALENAPRDTPQRTGIRGAKETPATGGSPRPVAKTRSPPAQTPGDAQAGPGGARHAGRRPPEGNEWLHEIKFDGYRMLCSVDRERPAS